MSNLHRLAWLDANIRSERYPNSRTLAEKFEISVRQAQRDIEYLKYTMGAPLEYSAVKRGYYYTDKTYLLPNAMISDTEKQILNYMANQYKMVGGTEVQRLADLFTRLGGGSCNSNDLSPNLPVLQFKPDEARNFKILKEALDGHRKLSLMYINDSGVTTNRIFHTYKLFNKDMNAYVTGFCELRTEIRTFRVSRIRKLDLLDDTYMIPNYFNEAYYGHGKGFMFKSPYTALVEFEQTPELCSLKLKAEQVAGKMFRIYFFSSDEIITALLLYNSSFKIAYPNWLKHKLRQRLEKILQFNFGSDNICRTPPV